MFTKTPADRSRDNWRVATSTLPPVTTSVRRPRAVVLAPAGELFGALALVGAVAAVALLALSTAAAPNSLVPTFRTMPHFFPAWLAGPLHPVGLATSGAVREAAVLVFCGCYAIALRFARSLPARALWAAVILAHLAMALAPPLLSGDVFGYIGFARLDVIHGLSPYAHTASAMPRDAVLPLLGWRNTSTPYGPLFTLLTLPLAPLGIAAGLWTLKAVAALTSLATVALIGRGAGRLGHSSRTAVAIYGLNPLVILFAIGGAHNETLFGLLLVAGALSLLAAREERSGVAFAAAAAIKASAALVLPFAVIGARRRRALLVAGLACLALAAAVGAAVFGPHLLSVGGTWLTQQNQVAGSSLPSKASRILGLGNLALGVRVAFLAAFATVLVAMLWRSARGAFWLDCYGWTTLALLAASAWILPWYGLWTLAPASLSGNRRLRGAALAATAYLVSTRILAARPLLG
jgi:Glycosyltransferase family 87